MISPKKRKFDSSHDSCDQTIPFDKCHAKTYHSATGEKKTGRTVLEHCQIVAEVARELVRRFPPHISQQLFPSGFELIAGIHDVGKVSPTFQKKILQNTDDYQPDSYPALKGINSQLETNWGGHAGVSQLTLEALKAGKYLPEIVGQHHGFNPQVGIYLADGEMFGGRKWQQERVSLIEELCQRLKVIWPHITSPEQARLVAGLTSVSDWIGSGEDFENPGTCWQGTISIALNRAGFIPPRLRKDMGFEEIFGFQPYPAQTKLIEHAIGPGIYVLEAPMGQGKTEAALYAAYQLLGSQQATGIYFALPTQMTSNKIYERFNSFLETILEPDCFHRKALLLHGTAWLLEQTEMGKEGEPGGSWFNTCKRGLLAPFAVGTLDQALMAAMNVKHGFVRAFGLAGKIVILDEVHSYDIYTGTILYALVKMLRALHCTIIILSATLTKDRRQQLLDTTLTEIGYPLITAQGKDTPLVESPVKIPSSRTFNLLALNEESKAKEEALCRAEKGQQVLWIENSVDDAQKCYLNLAGRAAEIGIKCGLLHSRFTTKHRQQKEDYWVRQFGKSGWKTRNRQGRILIGTQVLEQSLDIDADFLITRFCPTDMILQRMGRLWRHPKTPRHASAKKEAWLITPSDQMFEENPGKAFGISGLIYNPYVLCRSLEVWKNRNEIALPKDIRPLIEATYYDREEVGNMANLLYELNHGNRYQKGRCALEQLARITLSRNGKTLPETKAQTRYSEIDTIEVLLVHDISFFSQERKTGITLLDGEMVFLPWERYRIDKKAWKQLSAKLMNQTVFVRPAHAPLPLPRESLKKIGLGNCFYLGKPEHEESLLRVAFVDKAGYLEGFQGAPLHEKKILKYRDDLGYRIEEKKE